MAEAGYRDYTGFRRGAHVVYVGRFHPDLRTALGRLEATGVAARWGAALSGVVGTTAAADGRRITATEVYHQD